MSIISELISGGAKGLFEGVGEFAKDIREAITGDISAEKKAELQQKAMEIEFAITKAQTDINLAEASHVNVFVAGWRPAVGWVCGFALAYVSILEPIGRFIATVLFKYTGAFPVIDTNITMQVLIGLLGLGGMRTFEKTKDVESNR
jgi:hypothetical protein